MRPLRRRMQMVFQDPFASLNPRHFDRPHRSASRCAMHGLASSREARGARARAARARRAARRRRGALPARVLGRPAAAHRDRARARRQPRLHRLRRAGVGARRLDPGADHQPARGAAGRLRPDVPLHRARPRGRPAHLRPHRRHVPRQRSSRCRRRTSSTRRRCTRTRSRCSRRCRSPIPSSSGSASRSCSPATCRARRTRRSAAASTRAARTCSRRAAATRCPRCAQLERAHGRVPLGRGDQNRRSFARGSGSRSSSPGRRSSRCRSPPPT